MIILQPKCRLSRDMLVRDEAALSQKIKDKEAVIIIPGEYDIVSIDDACKSVKVEKKNNEIPLNVGLVGIDWVSDNILLKNRERGLNG